MNEDIKDFKIPTMEEFEEKMMGHKKKKQEETKEENTEEEQTEETRQDKIARLKEQAKQKRQELDSIYDEMEQL